MREKGTPSENSCKTPEEILEGTPMEIPRITTVETLGTSREEHRKNREKSFKRNPE